MIQNAECVDAEYALRQTFTTTATARRTKDRSLTDCFFAVERRVRMSIIPLHEAALI